MYTYRGQEIHQPKIKRKFKKKKKNKKTERRTKSRDTYVHRHIYTSYRLLISLMGKHYYNAGAEHAWIFLFFSFFVFPLPLHQMLRTFFFFISFAETLCIMYSFPYRCASSSTYIQYIQYIQAVHICMYQRRYTSCPRIVMMYVCFSHTLSPSTVNETDTYVCMHVYY